MAEMQEKDSGKKGKKPKQKKHATRVDLTPMVDLGFLLITFFMLTTSMLKPQTMEIGVPSKDDVKEADQNKVKASQAITVLIGKENKLYYFFGTEDKGVAPELIETDYSSEGIRKMLITKNYDVVKQVEELKKAKADKKVSQQDYDKQLTDLRGSKTAPVVMIKAADNANYKNLVDILDEMNITNIARYAIVDITPDDLAMIAKKTSGAK